MVFVRVKHPSRKVVMNYEDELEWEMSEEGLDFLIEDWETETHSQIISRYGSYTDDTDWE